jgi:hypothetical protein
VLMASSVMLFFVVRVAADMLDSGSGEVVVFACKLSGSAGCSGISPAVTLLSSNSLQNGSDCCVAGLRPWDFLDGAFFGASFFAEATTAGDFLPACGLAPFLGATLLVAALRSTDFFSAGLLRPFSTGLAVAFAAGKGGLALAVTFLPTEGCERLRAME